eukprot:7087444-Prymnesium_polylepis.1
METSSVGTGAPRVCDRLPRFGSGGATDPVAHALQPTTAPRGHRPWQGSGRERYQLDVEDQGGVGWDDTTSAAAPVSEVGRDLEQALLAHLHIEQRLVPALDDLAHPRHERQRRATSVRGVKALAIEQEAGVVRLDLGARRWFDSKALFDDAVREPGGCGLHALKVGLGERRLGQLEPGHPGAVGSLGECGSRRRRERRKRSQREEGPPSKRLGGRARRSGAHQRDGATRRRGAQRGEEHAHCIEIAAPARSFPVSIGSG